jgi:hypothetical protein
VRTILRYILGLSVIAILHPSEAAAQQEFPPAIEDNSFFIEEAYNQESGIVQHITNGFFYNKPQKDFSASFTQEWPVGSRLHQLSYTIPYLSLAGGSFSGVGDILINYRYQLFDPDEHPFAMSPRLSVLLPTGKKDDGLGSGVAGVQVNLPFSRRIAARWVFHLNAGITLLPSVTGDSPDGEVKKTLTAYSGGGSLIWLAGEKLNVMLEGIVNNAAVIGSGGEIERSTEVVVNPGVRYAIDIGTLQIVPGVALPVSITDNLTRVGVLGYLSFEHPF